MDSVITWLENHQIPCLYHRVLGIECPGCGLQRSFIELLKGNLGESFMIYPPLLPVMCLFGFLLLHLVFHFKKGANILKISAFIAGGIMFINYMINLITH
jgi:hypothetical protein